MVDCNTERVHPMEAEKTVGLSFRVTPKMKRMLEAAATRERRSLTNMLEFLVDDYCKQNNISEIDIDGPKTAATTGKQTA
jgi:hypothetical protein